jgi:hypothetical protein
MHGFRIGCIRLLVLDGSLVLFFSFASLFSLWYCLLFILLLMMMICINCGVFYGDLLLCLVLNVFRIVYLEINWQLFSVLQSFGV